MILTDFQKSEMEKGITLWLLNGEIGASSKCLARAILGEAPFDIYYPHDPDDFYRCYRLVSDTPHARKMLKRASKLCPEWGILVKKWNKVESKFLKETNGVWEDGSSAPETYIYMQKIYDKAKNKETKDENALTTEGEAFAELVIQGFLNCSDDALYDMYDMVANKPSVETPTDSPADIVSYCKKKMGEKVS